MLKIVSAVIGDAQVIHQIQMKAFAEEGRLSDSQNIAPLAESIDAIELQIQTLTVLTAFEGAQVIGSIRGSIEGDICNISRLSVDPSYQGRGVGAALLIAIENAHPNVTHFALQTNMVVPGNVLFYERRGYQVTQQSKFAKTVVLAYMLKVQRAGPTEK